MAGTWIALLRGINVGKAKRVAMADLRAVIESVGYRDARTLLNSGNAIFASPRALKRDAAETLQAALAARTGVSSRFTLRSAEEFEAVFAGNPLARKMTDPTRMFAAFLYDRSDAARLAPLAEPAWNRQAWKPEALAVGDGVAYIWSPNGLLESAAFEAVGRVLGERVTIRNWATVGKIREMVREVEG